MAERPEAGWGPLPHRGRVRLHGYLESVTYPSPAGAPLFAARLVPEVAPPSGRHGAGEHVKLLWVGQRRVAGIEPGTWVRCSGLLTREAEEPVLYDPRYEILAEDTEDES